MECFPSHTLLPCLPPLDATSLSALWERAFPEAGYWKYSTSLTSPRDICADRTALSQKEATLHIYVHLPINGFSGAIPWNSFTPNTALTSPHSVTGIRCFTRRRGSYSSYSHHSCWENYWEGSKDAYKPDRILDWTTQTQNLFRTQEVLHSFF